jgi:metallopeptidase MepB
LEQKLRPLGLRERETLLALKQEECKEKGLPFDGILHIWDFRYYDRLFIEKYLDLDENLVKEYFPVSVVVPVIIDIYRTLLGVRFEEIKEDVWHPGRISGVLWVLEYFLLTMQLQMSSNLRFGIKMP